MEKYKIFKTLAQEGGRTSRGSIRRMEAYVHWLNKIHGMGLLDLEAIERYWIGEVEKFFHAKPFKIRELSAHSVEAIVSDLLEEAFRRQQRSAGTMYAGTLLQHLVGAKLELKWPGRVTHHPAAEADDVSDRPGDFLVEDASIHVTTSPSDTLVEKCTANLHQGCRPVIVTVEDSVGHARTIAKRGGILSRIEIQSAQQFLSSNINEWSGFKASARTGEIKRLVAKYNELIDAFEGDPSLRIELR
ncbi:MAG: DUF4928 family protein [Planctomycetota bacterium]|nr:DUF4928 family protein [Planctomycetota bacterium]